MARSTPTYTPAGKYILGGIISALVLIADLNYQTFNSVRGLTQASGIYSQLILGNIFEYTTKVTVIYQDKKDLIATKGRASFLGERAKGHIDPGARSSQLAIEAICNTILNK